MKIIALRLTDHEYESLLKQAAGDHANNLSSWIRTRLFTDKAKPAFLVATRHRRGKHVALLPNEIRTRLAPALKKKPAKKTRSKRG